MNENPHQRPFLEAFRQIYVLNIRDMLLISFALESKWFFMPGRCLDKVMISRVRTGAAKSPVSLYKRVCDY